MMDFIPYNPEVLIWVFGTLLLLVIGIICVRGMGIMWAFIVFFIVCAFVIILWLLFGLAKTNGWLPCVEIMRNRIGGCL